uniref:Protein prickle-like n=1 Tax=Dermatophagoides pteronyssinus TaxID=6956 RepID=A0A6P6XR29_DERPT|nr:protein prickle-like [Dermatophagoides pteronyssinus]
MMSSSSILFDDVYQQQQQQQQIIQRYDWIPAGVTDEIMIDEYFAMFPENKRPLLVKQPNQTSSSSSDSGVLYWKKLFQQQFPVCDTTIKNCPHLMATINDRKKIRLLELIMLDRDQYSLDIGQVKPVTIIDQICAYCCKIIPLNSLAINCEQRIFESKINTFHPNCFRCFYCDQQLAYNIYCCRNNRPYCERHYMELLLPRCSFCDELIMSNEYIKDSKQKWHMEHFNCIYCQRSLTTARYALTESNDNNDNDDNNNCNNNNGKPMCIECYEQRHSNVCEECQKPIGVNTKDLSFNDRHWHEKCFVCSQCKFDLFDKPFGSRSDQIFCANCYDNTFAPRCCYCAEIFEPGQRKLDFRDKLYHDSCFCCKKCQIPIGTKTFLQKNNNIYCSECYKNVFATRCIKCCEIIINDGIQYRDEPWHASCFRCVECQKELSNIPFTSHDDRPYCRQCNANLFAPKCDICKQPIIGSTGRKMITHGNHKWHQSCFKCKDCSTELGGKGFVPLDNDGNGEENIYCTPCAQVIIAKQWTKQSTQNQQSKQQQQEEQQQDQHQQEQEQDQQSDDSV